MKAKRRHYGAGVLIVTCPKLVPLSYANHPSTQQSPSQWGEMKNFDTRTYSVSDFAEWQTTGLLRLSPEFQRRAVWTTKAKSYLIDTILRGKPMPKVLITQRIVDGRNVRTVVDGQQRLRAILEYLGGNFSVMRTHNQEFAGLYYSDLPASLQADFWQYEIGVDVLFDTELSELLDIFARLNTYSVKLNSTELLNATFLGPFKTAAHEMGHRYAQYLLEAGVLTNTQVARMGEVELAADLLGALSEGILSRKAIPSLYKKYDDDDQQQVVQDAAERFGLTMSYIAEVYPASDLNSSNFRRVHLFYSAFLSISNMLTELPVIIPGRTPSLLTPSRTRVILDNISAEFDQFTSGDDRAAPPDGLEQFVEGARRATTDQSVRLERSRFISSRLTEGAP